MRGLKVTGGGKFHGLHRKIILPLATCGWRKMHALRWAITLVLASLLVAVAGVQRADAQEAAPPADLEVGVMVSPPFVEAQGENAYSGMAIDLWETVARQLGLSFQYVQYPNFRELVQATANGEIDAAVTNLTITRNRAEAISFTQPWYDAGLRIMVPEEGGGGFWGVVAGLQDAGHLRAYAWLLFVIVVATVLFTLFDRRFDPDFPRRWREGIAESFYHVMSIATSGRTSRKNLFGWVGRFWQAIWLAVGVAVIAYVTSSVTSVMTAVSLTQGISSVSDLPGKTVAVFTGSVAEEYMQEFEIASRSYAGIDESVAALRSGRVDAIVADAPILEHYAHTHTEQGVAVVGSIFHPDKYGFAFPHGSALERPVTLEILHLQENGALAEMNLRYFGNAN